MPALGGICPLRCFTGCGFLCDSRLICSGLCTLRRRGVRLCRGLRGFSRIFLWHTVWLTQRWCGALFYRRICCRCRCLRAGHLLFTCCFFGHSSQCIRRRRRRACLLPSDWILRCRLCRALLHRCRLRHLLFRCCFLGHSSRCIRRSLQCIFRTTRHQELNHLIQECQRVCTCIAGGRSRSLCVQLGEKCLQFLGQEFRIPGIKELKRRLCEHDRLKCSTRLLDECRLQTREEGCKIITHLRRTARLCHRSQLVKHSRECCQLIGRKPLTGSGASKPLTKGCLKGKGLPYHILNDFLELLRHLLNIRLLASVDLR